MSGDIISRPPLRRFTEGNWRRTVTAYVIKFVDMGSFAALVAPISLGLAWWFWARARRDEIEGWRCYILLAGLIAASANTAAFCTWIIYRLSAGPMPQVWKAKEICASASIGFGLLALGASIFGQVKISASLVACAIFGFLMWVDIGIL